MGWLPPGNPCRAIGRQDPDTRRARLDASLPRIAAAVKRLDVSTAILDGEAVVLDEQGRSDFSRLTASLGGRGGKRVSTETLLYAFGLLYLDGIDISGMALSERRHLLEDLLEGRELDEIRLSEEIFADGAAY
jgi:bifunctional non-homologous end joining protein LigD